jgi:hypothetical protein
MYQMCVLDNTQSFAIEEDKSLAIPRLVPAQTLPLLAQPQASHSTSSKQALLYLCSLARVTLVLPGLSA